jgi:hypothetical protein
MPDVRSTFFYGDESHVCRESKSARCCEHLSERNGKCGGVSGKGGEKNTTRRVEIFLSRLLYPCKHVFPE